MTKGPTALVAQILADRGLMDVDAPVAAYWPEFAALGKDRALVRHILSHTLGLPSLPGYWDLVTTDDPVGWHRTDEIAAWLAAAPLAWEPGTNFGYHSMRYGWFVGELVDGSTGVLSIRSSRTRWPTRSGWTSGSGFPPSSTGGWPGSCAIPTRWPIS